MIKLAIQGCIIVPVGRPFTSIYEEGSSDGNDSGALCEGEEWIADGCLKMLHNHVISVDDKGIIDSIVPATSPANIVAEIAVHLGPDEFLCPGFVDLHVHSAQFAYTGTATDRTLFEWLEHYTFPAEQRLHDDPELPYQVYSRLVDTMVSYGTTTAVYHTTLHVQPCEILVDCLLSAGQRAVVGKVCMDRNSPDTYSQSTDQNLSETQRLFSYIYAKAGRRDSRSIGLPLPLILPSVIPRFIPTCSPALLTKLGTLAKEHDCYITTHISEGLEEVEYSQKCDKEDHGLERTGSEVLEAHGLLSDKCVLAHCVYVTDSDCDLLKRQGCAICHCPLSNFFFAGGTFRCREILERGNLVGLGTDVAGGYSPSLLHAQRDAVVASRALDHNTSTKCDIDYRHAFWLATLGGAESLNLHDKIGSFRAGMEFDAIVLSPSGSPVQVFDTDSKQDIFQKLLVLGDDRNVKSVFVQGRKIK